MSAPPTIPPRPSRAQNESNPASSSHMDVPKIPPRPKRSIDRSISPNRDTFARSPLNDPAFLHDNQSRESGLGADLPPRPPSVSLPSIGQEGNEYASFDDLSKTLTNENAPEQTKNVAGDLPLYAPTASVPSSTAKSRIETVTRTDSQQAAAAGIGKLLPDDKSARGADSGRSASSAGGNTRPSSVYKEEEEQGIPEIGIQVPMYPNAGDVQAPTPSPFETAVPTGVGFFNKGGHTPGRHHGRTKSGREVFHGPPGSYGLHGHGVIPKDEFGQKWYAKHPEDLAREKAGEYGPHIQENRKEYHWHGEKLEKLVHDANAKGIGLGTSREAISTPDEQIGYLASEEFASRMASPKPQSGRPASITSKTANPAESPLRQTNFPAGQLTKQKTHESEPDEDVIHIDPPAHRMSKINGVGYEEPTEDLGPEGGNTGEEGGWVSERGYGIPILASDEIQKYPGAKFRQPAVSPELERRASGEYTVNEDGTPAYISKPRPHSRSSSRNNAAGQRYMASPSQHDRSGTPLESHKEYEPLFPEDEETVQKPKSAVDKLKRPDHLARHHFPSQDVWEDTPSSLQLETTVDTPQLPEEPETSGDVDASKIFEKPEQEEARKDNIPEEDQQSFLPEHTKRFANKRLSKDHLDLPNRPGMQQRFPSQDIWEDAPEHGHLETTVSGPQSEDTNEYAEDAPVAVKNATADKPTIPSRPQKAKEISPIDKKPPGIPDKPKPQLPARPVKPLIKSSDKVPTLQSEGSIDAAPQPKAKPAVPARPGGSKIAALQAGFMKDLNSKLGLGPPKVKEPEPEKEEEPPKPLQDARKGRAKGPQRRKPASSPTPAAAATVVAEVAVPRVKLELAPVTTLWSIGDDGVVDAPAASMAVKLQAQLQQPAKSELSEVAEQDKQVEPEEAESQIVTEEVESEDKPSKAVESEDVDASKPATQEPATSIDPASSASKPELDLEPESALPLEEKGGFESTDKSSASEPGKTEVAEPVEAVEKDENETEKEEATAKETTA